MFANSKNADSPLPLPKKIKKSESALRKINENPKKSTTGLSTATETICGWVYVLYLFFCPFTLTGLAMSPVSRSYR